MKNSKIWICIVFLFVLTVHISSAQTTDQKSKPTLPKAGDLGLGIDLIPVLDYLGNMFNGTTNNTLNSFGGEPLLPLGILAPGVSIKGKYMQTDNMAYRFNFGTIGQTAVQNVYIRDDAAFFNDPLSEARVVDTHWQHRSGMSFSVGMEYRRGYNRIQGYTGLDLIYGFEMATDVYEYGNAVTEINQMPSRGLIGTAPIPVPYWTQTYVTGKYFDGSAHYFGLGAVVGVEYFLASHLSLGGEITIYALQMIKSQAHQKQEGFNTITNKIENRTELLSPGDRSFSFGTQNLGGKLYMMFYF